MPFSDSRFFVNALSVCFLLVAAPETYACKVPVFRYALEHWVPDPYQAIVLHRGAISDGVEALVVKLEAMSTDSEHFANLKVRRVDVEVDVEQEDEVHLLTELLGPKYQEKIESPEIVLLYPRSSQSGPLAWQGALTRENIDALIDSPARRQITESILAGESAVWVLIGGGNVEKDKLAEETLRTQLARLENELELRDIEVIEAESEFGQGTTVELRLGLELLVLDRDDPREKIFAQTILRSGDDLEKLGEPVAIPVFGRGRAFLALVGNKINSDNIEESCHFLIGDCSCEVKRFNPGVDLLFDIDWDGLVVGSAGVDQPLPFLEGIGLYDEITLDEPKSDGPSDGPSNGGSPGRSLSKIELATTQTSQLPSGIAPKHFEQSAPPLAEGDAKSSVSSFGQRLTFWLVGLIALGAALAAITTARLRSQASHR